MPSISSAWEFVSSNKRHLATVAFIVGFLVDIITFRTLNLEVAQIILAGYLVILAGSILVLATPERVPARGILKFIRSWLPVVQQYAAGNLLSAFLVLYFSSGSLSASWPFLAVVALAALGNDRLSLERYRVPFQTTLFFLNLVLFFALATPVAFRSLGFWTFLSSIAISSVLFLAFFLIGRFVAGQVFRHNALRIGIGAFGIGALVVVLYATNLIPPIPLSTKNIDFYHSVAKAGSVYVATDEQREWYERFLDIGGVRLHLTEGEAAYAYSSIFAPAHFGANIVHEWEMQDTATGAWVVKNRIRFHILGGRAEGYRGYSLIENPLPGRWRISVKTSEGAVIGRMHLTVVRVASPVAVMERVLQ